MRKLLAGPKCCPNCMSGKIKRSQDFENIGTQLAPSWRCWVCNVRFVITNPSYLGDAVARAKIAELQCKPKQ